MTVNSAPEKFFARWDRAATTEVAVSLAALVIALLFCAEFLAFTEQRRGVVLTDPVLAVFGPADATWFIFVLLYTSIVAAAASALREPRRFALALQAYSLTVVFRMAGIWLVPLEAPVGTIPLVDPFVRFTTHGAVLMKDLFFSGHTATMFLCAMATPRLGLRALLILGTVLVGSLLLLQHVHYTFDVFAAPAFAWAAWSIVVYGHEQRAARSLT